MLSSQAAANSRVVHKSLIPLLLLILCLMTVTVLSSVQAKRPIAKREGTVMSVENDKIRVIVRQENGLPLYNIYRKQASSTAATPTVDKTFYTVSFDDMYQVSDLGDASKKVGPSVTLPSYTWTMTDAQFVKEDVISFTLTGTGQRYPTVAFTNHINSTSMGIEFDVSITDFDASIWSAEAVGVATCYSTKKQTEGEESSSDSSSTNIEVDGNEAVFGGAELAIGSEAVAGSEKSVEARLVRGTKKNSACIVYEKFSLPAYVVHDPSKDVVYSGAVVNKMSVAAVLFCLISFFILQ